MRSGHGWDRGLDRLSSSIYENAVRLHRRELRQMAGRTALLDLREKLADLKARIKAVKANVPSVELAYSSAH